MPIETISDIAEQCADLARIYGACPDQSYRGPIDCGSQNLCRCCFVADLAQRMREAVEVEKNLAAAREGANQ